MEIEWINKQYKEANRMLDSEWEVEEWTESLFSDISGYGLVNVGYATPDIKVFNYLSKHLPKWADSIRSNNPYIPETLVRTETEQVDGKPIYKIWVTASE